MALDLVTGQATLQSITQFESLKKDDWNSQSVLRVKGELLR